MPFSMSFAMEPENVTVAWFDNASVQFPPNIYATKGLIFRQLPHKPLDRRDSTVSFFALAPRLRCV